MGVLCWIVDWKPWAVIFQRERLLRSGCVIAFERRICGKEVVVQRAAVGVLSFLFVFFKAQRKVQLVIALRTVYDA